MKLAQEILLTNFVPAIITSCAFQNIIVSVCESLPSFIWMNVFSLLTNQQRIASIYAEVSCSKFPSQQHGTTSNISKLMYFVMSCLKQSKKQKREQKHRPSALKRFCSEQVALLF